jgi:hypothetical protein
MMGLDTENYAKLAHLNLKGDPLILSIEHDFREQFLNDGPIVSVFCEFASLSPRLLRQLKPATILCPLIGKCFDALDVCAAMRKANCAARLVLMTPQLPRPEMVLAELRCAHPVIPIELQNKPD